jgi:predicted CoA-binding protein
MIGDIHMDTAIQDFIASKRMAIVGVSRNGKKFGNMAYKELQNRGYQVYIVHPEAKEIEGAPCYPNLAALKEKVDRVVVSLPPEQGMQVLREAAQVGLKNVWIQQQGDSPELLALGRDLGLNLVHGKCILMYAGPVRSFHGFHRFFVKLVGQL